MAPLTALAAPYKFVWQVIPEYIETYTYAIPYWVSSYLFATVASYMSLSGLWLISFIQGAAGLTPEGGEVEEPVEAVEAVDRADPEEAEVAEDAE